MTNEELLVAMKKAAVSVSYYYAAEQDWGRETQDREKAEREWNGLKEEAMSRGIWNPHDFKHYMV